MQKITDYLLFKNLFGGNYLYYFFTISIILLFIDLCIGVFLHKSFLLKSNLLINVFAFIGAIMLIRIFIERYIINFIFINKLQMLLENEKIDIYKYKTKNFFSFDDFYIAWIVLFAFFIFSSNFILQGNSSWLYWFFIKHGVSSYLSIALSVVLQILHLRLLCEIVLVRTIFKLCLYRKMENNFNFLGSKTK